MTLDQFVKTNTGVPLSFWNNGSVQCVDVVRAYVRDVLKLPLSEQPEPLGNDGSAEWFFTRHETRPLQKRNFDRVEHQTGMIPPKGSILVFGPTVSNRFGHVAVCLEAGALSIAVFEQDGIENSKAKREGRTQRGCFVGQWKYDRLLGWLVPKGMV